MEKCNFIFIIRKNPTMGIQGFWSFIVKNYYEAFTSLSDLSAFAGQTWAIDTSIYMYKFALKENYIEAFLQQAADLQTWGITPLYIFDGQRHPDKLHEHVRRREQARRYLENAAVRTDLLAKLTAATNLSLDDARELLTTHVTDEVQKALSNTAVAEMTGCDDVEIELDLTAVISKIRERHDRQESRVIKVPDENYHQLMQIFHARNIAYCIAAGDAEKLGAQLCRTGRVQALVTDDGDALAFGATVVIRNLFRPGKSGMEAVSLYALLTLMQITQEQLIDVAIICGCDYTESRGLPGLGPNKALKVIQKYGSLQAFLASPEFTSKYESFDLNKFQHEQARAIFMDDSNQLAFESNTT